MVRFYINAQRHFYGLPLSDNELRNLLKSQGVEPRRLGRFTQLALLGALPLREKTQKSTALFLGSPFSSPQKFDKMFYQLLESHVPSPLDFMAHTHNAATFQLAQCLQTAGESAFLAADRHNYWQPLFLALNHLLCYPQHNALVGWAFEYVEPAQQEGSFWWVISTQAEEALAEIALTVGDEPEQFVFSDEFLQPIESLQQAINEKREAAFFTGKMKFSLKSL